MEPINFIHRRNRYTISPNGEMTKNEVIVPTKCKAGYWYYTHFPRAYFRSIGFHREPSIHAVIYFLFGPEEDKHIFSRNSARDSSSMTIDHINHDTSDNRISNLQKMEHGGNSGKRIRGRRTGPRRVYCYSTNEDSSNCLVFKTVKSAINHIGWYVKNILYTNERQYETMTISFTPPEGDYHFIEMPNLPEIRKSDWRDEHGNNRKDIIFSLLV